MFYAIENLRSSIEQSVLAAGVPKARFDRIWRNVEPVVKLKFAQAFGLKAIGGLEVPNVVAISLDEALAAIPDAVQQSRLSREILERENPWDADVETAILASKRIGEPAGLSREDRYQLYSAIQKYLGVDVPKVTLINNLIPLSKIRAALDLVRTEVSLTLGQRSYLAYLSGMIRPSLDIQFGVHINPVLPEWAAALISALIKVAKDPREPQSQSALIDAYMNIPERIRTKVDELLADGHVLAWVSDRELSEIEEKLDKLNRRAVKLGLPPVSVENLETEIREHFTNERSLEGRPGFGKRIEMAWHLLRVKGPPVQLKGWTFVAKLEPMGTKLGDVLISRGKAYDEAAFPTPESWRDPKQANMCEHCGLVRRRSATFVLAKSGEGGEIETIQVGRSCLADFAERSANDPEALADFFGEFSSAFEPYSEPADRDFEQGSFGGGPPKWVDLGSAVAVAVAAIWKFGFSPSKSDNPTSFVVAKAMFPPPHSNEKPYVPTETEISRAGDVIRYWRNLSPSSDFEHNSKAIFSRDSFKFDEMGRVVGAVQGYLRQTENEARKKVEREARPESQWVGKIGERLDLDVFLTFVKEIDGQFGTTYLHRMLTPDGSEVVWFGSNRLVSPDSPYPRALTIRATVKKHELRQGVKQTVVSRASEIKPSTFVEAKKREEFAAAEQAEEAKLQQAAALLQRLKESEAVNGMTAVWEEIRRLKLNDYVRILQDAGMEAARVWARKLAEERLSPWRQLT